MIIVRKQPGPFQVMFLIAAMLGGVALVALGRHLGSTLSQQLPPWVTLILAFGLIGGSGLSLLGMFLQDSMGLFLERAGLIGLSLLFLAYVGAILYYIGPRSVITVVFFVAFAVASLWRTMQISGNLREIQAAIAEAAARQAQEEGDGGA